MADVTVDSKQLRIVYQNGVKENGDVIEKRKLINNVEIGATAAQLYATAMAIASLQTLPLIKVEQQEIVNIIE